MGGVEVRAAEREKGELGCSHSVSGPYETLREGGAEGSQISGRNRGHLGGVEPHGDCLAAKESRPNVSGGGQLPDGLGDRGGIADALPAGAGPSSGATRKVGPQVPEREPHRYRSVQKRPVLLLEALAELRAVGAQGILLGGDLAANGEHEAVRVHEGIAEPVVDIGPDDIEVEVVGQPPGGRGVSLGQRNPGTQEDGTEPLRERAPLRDPAPPSVALAHAARYKVVDGELRVVPRVCGGDVGREPRQQG